MNLILLIAVAMSLLFMVNTTTIYGKVNSFLNIQPYLCLHEENISNFINIYTRGILSTLIMGLFAYLSTVKRNIAPEETKLKLFLWLCLLYYLIFMLPAQLLNLGSMRFFVDFAVHLECLHKFISGQGVVSTLEESFRGFDNYLGAHFFPIMFVLTLPPFYLFPYPETLLVVQTLALLSTCLPLYLYARERLGNNVAPVFLVASFVSFFPLQYVNLKEFEYLRFAIPLLCFTFYFMYKRNFKLYALCLVLSLMVREEVSLTTFALGLYALFFLKERSLGFFTSLLSLAYFFLVTDYAMPKFREGVELPIYYPMYSDILSGQDPFKIIFYPLKIANLLLLHLPVLFLSLLSPLVLVTLPNLGTIFLVNNSALGTYSIFMYYFAPSIPFIFLASIEGIANLQKWISEKSLPYILRPGPNGVAIPLSFAILTASLTSNFFFGPSPLSRQFWDESYKLADFNTFNFHRRAYISNAHCKTAQEILNLVPPTASISAEAHFLPYLCNRRRLNIFPQVEEEVEYVLIDKNKPGKRGAAGETYIDFGARPQYYYDRIEKDPAWELIKEKDGVLLFRRSNPRQVY